MNWYLDVLRNYAVFDGRARRKEYWMFVLGNLIVSILLIIVGGILGIRGFLTLLYSLGIFIPCLALTIRRLHDTDRSGWWLLISLIPLLGGLVLFVFMVLPGTAGSNRFGLDPKSSAAIVT